MTTFGFRSVPHRHLLIFAALFRLTAESAGATTLTVGAIDANGVACTLADAIVAADNNTYTGGCPAGSKDETDIIELTGDVILTEALPEVRSYCSPEPNPCAESVQTYITINGHGHSIARSRHPDTPKFDLLTLFSLCGEGIYMPPPIVKLNEVELKNGDTGIVLKAATLGTECPPELDLVNSRITDNNGAGISARFASLRLTNSVIENNGGRGIGGYASDIELTDSTVAHNVDRGVSAHGGLPFYERRGVLSVTRSTLAGNTGGGIELAVLHTTLVNSTVSGNGNRKIKGGGIHVIPSDSSDEQPVTELTLINTTVSHNVAELGGGVYRESGEHWFYIDTSAMMNSILADNTGGDCVSAAGTTRIAFIGQNLIEDGGCFDPSYSNPPLIGDPKLGPLEDNGGPTPTHALLEGSQALDRIAFVYGANGNPLGCEGTTDGVTAGVVTDQRGERRPQPGDDFCDIGAFEHAVPSNRRECQSGGYKKFGFDSLEQCLRYLDRWKTPSW
ncbi:choice-of-anchor Q domain-containing protein [Methylocaldum sp. MU1018]